MLTPMKPKLKCRFHVAIILLLYILQKNCLNKSSIFTEDPSPDKISGSCTWTLQVCTADVIYTNRL